MERGGGESNRSGLVSRRAKDKIKHQSKEVVKIGMVGGIGECSAQGE